MILRMTFFWRYPEVELCMTYQNSFYVRAPSVWNTLPKDLRDTSRSVSSFKANLSRFYHKMLEVIFIRQSALNATLHAPC